MATYDELLLASENSGLMKKVRVALFIAAETVRTENPATANHTERLAWAKSVFNDEGESMAPRMMRAVLAQNKTATLAQITGASDATVQTAVDAAVNVFAL